MKNWRYVKIGENQEYKECPTRDFDGSVTGHIVFGVKEWFDENPEERIRRGWIKMIQHNEDEVQYNHQTQYLEKSTRVIDDYTIEEVYNVLDKSEDMLALEEKLESLGLLFNQDGITWSFGGTV